MLTLFSYPDLFGVADNNPYGLKVYAFLKLCKLPARTHPRHQRRAARAAACLLDGETAIGDSDAIIPHLIARYALPIADGLKASERNLDHFMRRMLDDLYWVMSYLRWKDPRFWPLFRNALVKAHSVLSEASLEKARAYNFKRHYYQGMAYQGIARYEPEAV